MKLLLNNSQKIMHNLLTGFSEKPEILILLPTLKKKHYKMKNINLITCETSGTLLKDKIRSYVFLMCKLYWYIYIYINKYHKYYCYYGNVQDAMTFDKSVIEDNERTGESNVSQINFVKSHQKSGTIRSNTFRKN